MLTSAASAPTYAAETAEFDAAQHEAFGERMVGMLHEAALTFMFSIGHRTGLLDTLPRLNRAATTHEIADEAGLDERYIREWLLALVTGRVIDYDPSTRGYRLPPEHAAWLTREATPNNVAGMMQFMSMFGNNRGPRSGLLPQRRRRAVREIRAFSRRHSRPVSRWLAHLRLLTREVRPHGLHPDHGIANLNQVFQPPLAAKELSMKNALSAVVVVSLLLAASAVCSGQEMPEMPKPQKEHEWLQRFVGEWESEAEANIGPDQPPMKCEGTQQARMLGGFWMIAEGKTEVMEMPVQSVLTLGYDPKQQKYVGTWTDSCHNYLWTYEGEVSEDGKTLTLNTEGPNFAAPDTKAKYREVIEFKDKDHYVFSSMAQSDDGEWVTFMTAHFRRANPEARGERGLESD